MSALPGRICKKTAGKCYKLLQRKHAGAQPEEDCSQAPGKPDHNQRFLSATENCKLSQHSALWAPGCPSAFRLTGKGKTAEKHAIKHPSQYGNAI